MTAAAAAATSPIPLTSEDLLVELLQQIKKGLKVHQPVWIEPGPNCISFAPAAYLQLSSVAIGSTETILTFLVPDGFNAVIYDLANTCDDPAFVDGSGALLWSIEIDTNYAQNFNAISAQRGTVDAPVHLSCPIFVKEGQIVTFQVQNVSLIASSGPVIGGLLGGWFYPASEEPEDSWA
jgi:hypothetical protein